MEKKMLSPEKYDNIKKFMMTEARELEKSLFLYLMEDGPEDEIIKALREFQNDDGGFGRGLEPDFMLPDSSPMATSIGLGYLKMVKDNKDAQTMIKRAIGYLEDSYIEEEKRWKAVPKEVNDYPHAPWWSFNPEDNMTVIDKSWGNPTVELIGYLQLFNEYVGKININGLKDKIYKYINEKKEWSAEHEIYCFIKYFNMSDDNTKAILRDKLKDAVTSNVDYDSSKWETYVPYPLTFIETDSTEYFGIKEEEISKNLDYVIDKYNEQGLIYPNWTWGVQSEQWEIQKKKWTGYLQVQNLVKLKKFGRIE